MFRRLLLISVLILAPAELARSVGTSMILKHSDVGAFEAKEIPGPTRRLKISGFAFHSALFVSRVESKADGRVITVLVHLTGPVTTTLLHFTGSARRFGRSGNFDYDLDIPGSVNEVRFGPEGTVIWRRKFAD